MTAPGEEQASWALIDDGGTRAIEGSAGAPWLATVQDAARVVEACLSCDADAALLYASNLTPAFFDLSSRDAGEILQKLRNYRIRLAVVCPGDVPFSSRFAEMLIEERRGRWFGVFDARGDALEWLAGRRITDPERLRAEAVALARDVLEGRSSAILAAKRMSAILQRLGVPERDPDLDCFVLIESETDALPVGIVRAQWDREALRRKEADVARSEAWAKEVSEEALRNVLRRWALQT